MSGAYRGWAGGALLLSLAILSACGKSSTVETSVAGLEAMRVEAKLEDGKSICISSLKIVRAEKPNEPVYEALLDTNHRSEFCLPVMIVPERYTGYTVRYSGERMVGDFVVTMTPTSGGEYASEITMPERIEAAD